MTRRLPAADRSVWTRVRSAALCLAVAGSHEIPLEARPDARHEADSVASINVPCPSRSHVLIEVTPDHARAALQSP